jgi:hypothetical protein
MSAIAQSIIRKVAQARLQGGPGAEPTVARSHWVYTAEAGTSIADILQYEYWMGLQPMPQPWDLIEVREELGAWWAELLVRQSTSEGIVVAGIKAIELETVAPRNYVPFDGEGCTVVYKGPFLKWCCETREGRQLQGGFDDESKAAAWLRDHLWVKRNT